MADHESSSRPLTDTADRKAKPLRGDKKHANYLMLGTARIYTPRYAQRMVQNPYCVGAINVSWEQQTRYSNQDNYIIVTLKLYGNDFDRINHLSVFLSRFQFGLPPIGNHSQFLATFLLWLEPPVGTA